MYTETRLAKVFNTMTGQASSLTVNSAFVLVSDHAPQSCVTTSMTFRDATGYALFLAHSNLRMLLINYLIEHPCELRCKCLRRLCRWHWVCLLHFSLSLFFCNWHVVPISEPMGVYGTSTWYQGVKPTPDAHPPASSSDCTTLPTITASPLRRRHNGIVRRHPSPTPFPATNWPVPPAI